MRRNALDQRVISYMMPYRMQRWSEFNLPLVRVGSVPSAERIPRGRRPPIDCSKPIVVLVAKRQSYALNHNSLNADSQIRLGAEKKACNPDQGCACVAYSRSSCDIRISERYAPSTNAASRSTPSLRKPSFSQMCCARASSRTHLATPDAPAALRTPSPGSRAASIRPRLRAAQSPPCASAQWTDARPRARAESHTRRSAYRPARPAVSAHPRQPWSTRASARSTRSQTPGFPAAVPVLTRQPQEHTA